MHRVSGLPPLLAGSLLQLQNEIAGDRTFAIPSQTQLDASRQSGGARLIAGVIRGVEVNACHLSRGVLERQRWHERPNARQSRSSVRAGHRDFQFPAHS